jgi:hypothetical protein
MVFWEKMDCFPRGTKVNCLGGLKLFDLKSDKKHCHFYSFPCHFYSIFCWCQKSNECLWGNQIKAIKDLKAN